MSEHTKFDDDPEALAWARAKVQRRIDHYAEFERKAQAEGSDHLRWRRMKNMLKMDFIGGEGCVIALFDHRLPELNAILDRKTSDV